jgi:hypothetical protein
MIARRRARRRDWRMQQLTSQVFRIIRHRDSTREWGREDEGGRHKGDDRQPHAHTLAGRREM